MRSLVCVLLVPLLAACAVTGGEQEWVDQPYAFPDAPGVVYLESFGSVMDVDPPSAFEKFVIGEDIYKGNQVITNPWGIATTRGKVYINDGFGNSAYFEYDLETRKLKAFPDPLLAGSSGIAVDSAGNKYVAVPRLVEAKAKGTFGTAEETGRVVVFDKRNRRTTVLDIPGRPVDVAVGDDKLFVSNLVRNNITVLDLKTLEITGAFGQNGPEGTELRGPRGIAVGGDGRVYVGDMFAGRVKVFEQDGTYVAQYGYRARFVGGFMAITGVDADKEGVVYAVDSMASLKGTHDDVQILKSWEFYTADEKLPDVEADPRKRKPALAGYFQKPGGVLKSYRTTLYRPISVAIDYDNVPYFEHYTPPGAKLTYLIWLTSRSAENGRNVTVFGHFVDQ